MHWLHLRRIEELGLLARPGMAVLDIGSSNLYGAGESDIAGFVRRHTSDVGTDFDAFVARLAHGAGSEPDGSARNGSFLGELLERAGFRYLSIDIAAGYRTQILDLNRERLPPALRGAFGLVLNFGTTEHVIDQVNCFRVIHDACAADGAMMHQVPASGHSDHGYFAYTGRFFFDLCSYNGYDILDAWLSIGDHTEDPFAGFRAYASHFPALQRRVAALGEGESARVAAAQVPVMSMNLAARKRRDQPFMLTVETSTSFGAIPADVIGRYRGDRAQESAATEPSPASGGSETA